MTLAPYVPSALFYNGSDFGGNKKTVEWSSTEPWTTLKRLFLLFKLQPLLKCIKETKSLRWVIYPGIGAYLRTQHRRQGLALLLVPASFSRCSCSYGIQISLVSRLA